LSDQLHDPLALPPIVEVPGSALGALCLCHLRTVIDPSLVVAPTAASPSAAGTLAGYTEWSARWRATEVYVSWKWAVLRETLIVLDPAALRTNILVTEEGRAVAPFQNIAYIFEWIETMPWRFAVGEVIADIGS
jgi:hypothetical protein